MDPTLEELLARWEAKQDPLTVAMLLAEALRSPHAERDEVIARAAATDDVDRLILLGDALWRQSWPHAEEEAARIFVKALTRDPSADEAVTGVNNALPFIEDSEIAVAITREALNAAGEDPRLKVALSQQLSRLGRPEQAQQTALEAIQALAATIRDGLSSQQTLETLTQALSQVEDPQVLTSAVEHALSHTHRHPVALTAWAAHEASEGRTDEAASLAREATDAVVPDSIDDPVSRSVLVRALSLLDRSQQHEVITHALTSAKDDFSRSANLGDALTLHAYSSGRWRPAAAAYTQALQLQPASDDALTGLSTAIRMMGDLDEFSPALERALRVTDRSARVQELYVTRMLDWCRSTWLLEHDELDTTARACLELAQREKRAPVRPAEILLEFTIRRWNGPAAEWVAAMDLALPDDLGVSTAKASMHAEVGEYAQAAREALHVLSSEHDVDDDRSDCLDIVLRSHAELKTLEEARERLTALAGEQAKKWQDSEQAELQLALFRIHASLLLSDTVTAASEVSQLAVSQSTYDAIVERAAVEATHGNTGWIRDNVDNPSQLRAAAFWVPRADQALPLRERAVERALARDFDAHLLPGLQFERGLGLGEIRHHAESIEAYQQATEAWEQPVRDDGYWLNGPYSQHNIAVAHEDMGDYVAASVAWRQAAESYGSCLSARDPYAYWAKCSAHLRIDDLCEAYEACAQGLRIDPGNLDLLRAVVEIDRKWRLTRARREARHAEKSPNEPMPELPTAVSWQAHEAARRLEQVLRKRAATSKNASHHREYAEFLMGREDYGAARPVLKRAVTLDPDDPSVRETLGRWHVSQDRFDEALVAFNRALSLRPDSHEIRSRLGQVLVKLGRRDAAFAALHEVRTLAPAHLETLIRLADLYVDRGDESDEPTPYEQAIELYEETLRFYDAGKGSKHLTSQELADIYYQCGYARVRLYERRTARMSPSSQVQRARADFAACLAIDKFHEKALIAQRRLPVHASTLRATSRERIGPLLIVMPMLLVFAIAQYRQHYSGTIDDAPYLALTFGTIVMAIAGLFLPELLKLKVGGVELEKNPVQQQREPEQFHLSR